MLAALLPLGSCMASVGVGGNVIPPDAGQTCAAQCQTIGMQLSAVATMAGTVGCVCQYASQPRASAGAAGAYATPAGGMAAIAAQQAAAAMALAQQQRMQQQRQMQLQQHY